MRFFEHSDAEAQRLGAVPIAEDPHVRGLRPEVATRWGSTLFSVQRVYTMWPRLTGYFRYRDLTADQRSRRVAHADWDPLRHLIGALPPVSEVTKACESSTATLADIFTLLVQLRLTLLADTVDVPKFPDVPLAVGAPAIEAYLKGYPEEEVMELDNRLYGSEQIYVDPTAGYDNLCTEARLAVHQLRTEMDRLVFSPSDTTKNWLQNPAVLTALLLTPGGGKMMQEVADWLNFENPTADAVADVERACAQRLGSLEDPPGNSAVGHQAGAPAARRVSNGRRAARSSLAAWGNGERLGGPAPAALNTREVVQAELVRFARLSAGFDSRDAHQFWRAHREHFRTLFPVAASGLGAAASSAACERDFSIAGRLVRA